MQEKHKASFGDIDIFELFSYYRMHLLTIVLTFIVCAMIAALGSKIILTPKYTATSKMYMVSSSTQSVVDITDLNIGTSISNDYIELLKARPVLESVIEDEKLTYSYKELLKMLKLSVITDTRIVQINVTSKDSKEAMRIANAIAEKGVKELPRLMETPEPHIAEYAVIPVTASSPNIPKNTALGAMVGLLSALLVLAVMYMLDDTIKTSEDIEKEFGVMPLSIIPEGHIMLLEKEEEEEELNEQDR